MQPAEALEHLWKGNFWNETNFTGVPFNLDRIGTSQPRCFLPISCRLICDEFDFELLAHGIKACFACAWVNEWRQHNSFVKHPDLLRLWRRLSPNMNIILQRLLLPLLDRRLNLTHCRSAVLQAKSSVPMARHTAGRCQSSPFPFDLSGHFYSGILPCTQRLRPCRATRRSFGWIVTFGRHGTRIVKRNTPVARSVVIRAECRVSPLLGNVTGKAAEKEEGQE